MLCMYKKFSAAARSSSGWSNSSSYGWTRK